MAKPLTADALSAITAADKNIDRLTRAQVFTLATGGFLDMPSPGKFVLTSKAQRAVKRMRRAEEAERIRPIIWEAIEQVAPDDKLLFRLDDVLKASGLSKADHRENILGALRFFRDGDMLENVKLSNNNFQIFWKRTAESFPEVEDDASDASDDIPVTSDEESIAVDEASDTDSEA